MTGEFPTDADHRAYSATTRTRHTEDQRDQLQEEAHRFPTVAHWGAYEAEVIGGRLVAMHPSPHDPEPSDIGRSMVGTLDGPTRVTQPMIRAGYLEHGPRRDDNQRGAEPFRAVSWETAIEVVAGELARVRDSFGPAAIYGGSYGWGSAGRFHHAQSQVHRFLGQFGGYTPSVGNYSFHAMATILPYVLGQSADEYLSELPTWDEIARDTEVVLAFGGMPLKNSQVNPGGVARHSVVSAQRRCRERGVSFVNLSPVRDAVDASLNAEWYPLRPNTDAALMFGIAHTILAEGRQDQAFLDRCCVGFEQLRAYLRGAVDGQPKDADWAAAICGLDASVIRDLSRRMTAKRTLLSVSWSIQRADHGEQPYWAAIALAAIAGQVGRAGGGVALGLGSIHAAGAFQRKLPVAALPQRNEASDQVEAIPVSRLSDMLLNPGQTIDFDGGKVTFPEVRLVYWCGGNPFHHHQDINRLVKAWQRPDTIIVHEPFWTPTARFADIVLPCTTPLERSDIAVGRSEGEILAMYRAVDPPPGAKDDYEIFSALAERLGFGAWFTEGRTADDWVRHLYDQTRTALAEQGAPIPEFEAFWSQARISVPLRPGDLDRRPALSLLRDDPVAHPLRTPSGRIELFSQTISDFAYPDCPGHASWLEPAEWLGSPLADRYPLHMLTPQPAARLHSQYDHGATSLESKVSGREPVLISQADAEARGINDGDVVRVHNERGACLAGAVVTDAVHTGVILLATGAWYDPCEPGVPGSLELHGNPNVLTLDKGTSSLSQGPSAQTVLVEIERFEGEPSSARPFDPPPSQPASSPPRDGA
ncbi:molybdopterin-dependent oxidoreductase [Streptomyces sp. NPDC090075]|uniref:molybdopterin-dependent oxidoreductase n=1 Tax=Streptomyces sp. NPDC090075 TaxID=3365937 RepID=UPI00382BA592